MSAVNALRYSNYPPVYDVPQTESISTALSDVLQGTVQSQSKVARNPALFPVHDQLNRVARFNDNWDGHGSVQPHKDSIYKARQLIEGAYEKLRSANLAWKHPHVSPSDDGEVALEWWNGSRKLTAYVSLQGMSYIMSWGKHPVDDMEEGELSQRRLLEIWPWLFP